MIYNINIWLLITIYATYSIVSILLFFFTSGSRGSTTFIYFIGGLLVYGFGFILLLINGIYRSFKSKINSANIRINLIQALLLIQFLALLLTQKDYDGNYIERTYIYPGPYLSIGQLWGDSFFYNPFLGGLGLFFLCIYLILLITFWLQILISKSGSKLT
ncbi:MAG: hypothetical protein WBA07_24400 [Rivularia sp. (in: cyanobacteria)]